MIETRATKSSTTMRPEVEVLLGCARTRMMSNIAQQVTNALKNGIDWDYFVCQTLRHGTTPLIFRNLSRIGRGTIPEATLNQLKHASSLIARSNLAATGELLKLLKLFGESGIRALPFKGPVLAAAAYGNLSFRQFCDLDILVDKADMLKAKRVLLDRGFEPALELSVGEEQAYLQTHHDYKFTRPSDGVVVEVQWGITQWSFAFPLAFEELWACCAEFAIAGEKVRTLRPDDLLLILSVHGAKHHWGQLKWICDIAELLAAHRQEIDWDRLIVQARGQGGERMLLLGLFMAHDLLDAELPEYILDRIQVDGQIKNLAAEVMKRLFRDRAEDENLLEERPFFFWRCRERMRDKLAIGWRYSPEYFHRMFVPNGKDRAALQLSPYLSFGYYFIHPIRLIKQRMHNFLRHRESARDNNR